jgi:hypothetical protein
VGNTPGNGLDHQRLPDVSSAYPCHRTASIANRDPDVPKSADQRCTTRTLSNTQEPPRLRVYVTKDTSDVYEEQFIRLASDQSGQIQPTLILMGVRLGIDHVTSVYWDGLQEALQYPQSVGIAG